MQDSAGSLLEKVLARCTEAKFTGNLRIRSPTVAGEIRFLSGIQEEVRFGISSGDEAFDRIKQCSNLTFDAVPCLPGIGPKAKGPFPTEGSLGESRPVDLLRLCDGSALTCKLEFTCLGHTARAIYELGDMQSIEADGTDDSVVAAMLEASEGTYRFVLPEVDLPREARSQPPPPMLDTVGRLLAEGLGVDVSAQGAGRPTQAQPQTSKELSPAAAATSPAMGIAATSGAIVGAASAAAVAVTATAATATAATATAATARAVTPPAGAVGPAVGTAPVAVKAVVPVGAATAPLAADAGAASPALSAKAGTPATAATAAASASPSAPPAATAAGATVAKAGFAWAAPATAASPSAAKAAAAAPAGAGIGSAAGAMAKSATAAAASGPAAKGASPSTPAPSTAAGAATKAATAPVSAAASGAQPAMAMGKAGGPTGVAASPLGASSASARTTPAAESRAAAQSTYGAAGGGAGASTKGGPSPTPQPGPVSSAKRPSQPPASASAVTGTKLAAGGPSTAGSTAGSAAKPVAAAPRAAAPDEGRKVQQAGGGVGGRPAEASTNKAAVLETAAAVPPKAGAAIGLVPIGLVPGTSAIGPAPGGTESRPEATTEARPAAGAAGARRVDADITPTGEPDSPQGIQARPAGGKAEAGPESQQAAAAGAASATAAKPARADVWFTEPAKGAYSNEPRSRSGAHDEPGSTREPGSARRKDVMEGSEELAEAAESRRGTRQPPLWLWILLALFVLAAIASRMQVVQELFDSWFGGK